MPDVVLVAGRDPRSERDGGHSAYVRAHARAAVAAGFTPHLVCVGPSAGFAETPYGVVRRAASPARPFRQLMIPGHAFPLRRAVEAAVAETGARVVHGFGVWSWAAAAARDRLAERGLPLRVLASAYTTLADETLSKIEGASPADGARKAAFLLEHAAALATSAYERRGYRDADLVLVNYESVRRLLEARHGQGLRIRRVPYASESAFEPPRPETGGLPDALRPLEGADGPLIVTVSRHDPRKGGDVLLEALALLAARGVPFRACLVGAGPLLEDHRARARRLSLGGRVSLPGYIEDALDVLTRADVFVLPSKSEQSGSLALLEALQAGRACIASACDGIPEDVTDGRDALLVPPGDVRALADALGRLLCDADLRARLGRAARATFEDRFSAKALADALGALYKEKGPDFAGPIS
ncbi:MAG: glycosyltransferase family 4 protein [Acidobacteriota bacterium]